MKRLIDIVGALCGLVVLTPVFLVVFVLVRSRLGSPAIFRQERPGLHGKPFVLCKFRTMTDARDADGNLLPDAERLTPFGKWLRATSLDELPELWNILRGDMSIVGPRPLLMRYLDRYTPEQARRHEVRPGLTGWTQVNGRNDLTWEEKFSMDVWYVENRSLLLDFKIILMTISTVLSQRGISKSGEATTAEFMGSGTKDSTAPDTPKASSDEVS